MIHEFDLADDDFTRTHRAILAGRLPDVAGEVGAAELLYSNLDDTQTALLKEMKTWTFESS